MRVEEYAEKVSHREHQQWLEYLFDQWNQPSRTDYYLIQLTRVVVGLLGGSFSEDSLRIKFRREERDMTSIKTAKQEGDIARARWFAYVGMDTQEPASKQAPVKRSLG